MCVCVWGVFVCECVCVLFQNYSCVLVISHHSVNEERVETAEKSGNFNLEGRTHLCACFNTVMLLPLSRF